MSEDVRVYDVTLSRALIAFVGQPGRIDEHSPEARVAAKIGDDAAFDVLPRVRRILDTMYGADPPLYDVPTEAELGQRASEWLLMNHPEVSPEAIRATSNRFAYDWR